MFSWFAKKPKTAVKVTKTSIGAHGDHWKTVLGSENACWQEILLQEIDQADQLGQPRPDMTRIQRAHGRLSFLGVLDHNDFCTLYPVLMTLRAVPVTIKGIIEWKHVRGVEAQIMGSGRDTFGLNFFATDYLEQADRYRTGGVLMVSLAGLAYVVQESPVLSPTEYSDEFCAYLPYEGSECSDYTFIGQIISVNDLTVCGEDCCILDVRLINDADDDAFFNLELLVNARHVTTSLAIGKRVSGTFWLQGRLALDTEITPQDEPEYPQPDLQPEYKQRRW